MGNECDYSFRDLFYAAHGRALSDEEYADLMNISQHQRNARIAVWAHHAGWEFESRRGTDGVVYTAFCPSFTTSRHL